MLNIYRYRFCQSLLRNYNQITTKFINFTSKKMFRQSTVVKPDEIDWLSPLDATEAWNEFSHLQVGLFDHFLFY